MNITAYRYRFIRYLEPVSSLFIRAGITPNIITVSSVIAGCLCALLYLKHEYIAGSLLLFLSAVLDLVDGTVARKTGHESPFGAVFDWIADKYVDAIVLAGAGLSVLPILSGILPVPSLLDQIIVIAAITGSLMNTFIKPVTYAEIGYQERVDGKIDDPLEGIGFFGRPETLIILGIGGLVGYIGIAIIVIAVCTNLSALQRIIYLYRSFS